MWSTETHWFDVAVVSTLLMLGQLSFGRFSEYQPRWRRLIKSVVGLVIIVGTSAILGRTWGWMLMGALGIALLIVHGWWLPRHGVNGWTAEPRARYYELMGLDAEGKRRERAP